MHAIQFQCLSEGLCDFATARSEETLAEVDKENRWLVFTGKALVPSCTNLANENRSASWLSTGKSSPNISMWTCHVSAPEPTKLGYNPKRIVSTQMDCPSDSWRYSTTPQTVGTTLPCLIQTGEGFILQFGMPHPIAHHTNTNTVQIRTQTGRHTNRQRYTHKH